MFVFASKSIGCGICILLSLGWLASARAAKPTPEQALALFPLQKNDVDFVRPTAEETADCQVDIETHGGVSGWVVRDKSGQLLRRFLDTNGDQKLDQWCYFKNGVEVYRDVDANFNGRADQYRWLGTEGIRWGLDDNEDGKIDRWKMISAEEVTAEVVAALRERDAGRFRRLLLTDSELKSLGLGREHTEELAKRIAETEDNFADVARQQRVVGADAQWVYFSGSRPGVLPAGTDGSTKDVVLYDNVTAVVEANGKHEQLVVGSLIRVDDVWRAIDLPYAVSEGQASAASGGLFFQVAARGPNDAAAPGESGLSEEMQQLMSDYESVEQSISAATSASQLTQLNERRAQILEKLIDASQTDDERLNWTRQFADIVSAAVQSGQYPGGLARLESVYKKLDSSRGRDRQAAYVKFRYLSSEYSARLQEADADFAKIQEQWLAGLQQFVKDYPQSDDAPDAMLQLALAQEFAGKVDEANQWYGRIVREFPTSAFSAKAAGAQTRINSVGKTIQLRGKTTDGRTVDLAAYRGRAVLIHYWATYCEPCKEEFRVLRQMKAKYGGRGFELIGISLDIERERLADYLRSQPLPWPQLFEEGGLDSRFATELGILTLPMMILVDKDGKVVRRNIHASELDVELEKLLR